ncbi:MAG: hypothetical protein IKA22_06705 [Lentisphaeria bacterium]|nr:hypothetical protein [Lentisphaeria bacterium]
MNAEKWIWLELKAFAPEAADFGVGNYIRNAGFTPDGVSLMLNAIDFVLLYGGMTEEYNLFDEVNGRTKDSAVWTNYQLRGLVRELKKYGIKVFFSVFTFYWMNKSRKEFIAQYPECAVVHAEQGKTRAVDVLSRLDDGRFLEDIFAENLYRIMCDYDFSGWHGPDWFGPGGTLKGSCSDNLVCQFMEYLQMEIPDGLELLTGDMPDKLQMRVKFIMENLHLEWLDFLSCRWETFWRKMTAAVKRADGECMINSPHTRSVWEASVYNGIDYRRIAALGVDYMIVETVAANFDLCNGKERVSDRISVYNSVLQEIKMSVPEMKLLFLHCIKDSGESYDVLRHTPAKLEHEFFRLSNLFYIDSNGDFQRCADGFMVCLGNAIEEQEWKSLRRIWDEAWDFMPVNAGDFIWLSDKKSIDNWRIKYMKYGIPAPSALAAQLTSRYDLHSAVITSVENLHKINSPAAVFNFDCCDEKVLADLLNFKNAPLLFIGNIADFDFFEKSVVASVKINRDYQLGAVILNGGCSFEYGAEAENDENWHCRSVSIFDAFPTLELPEIFFHAVGKAWRTVLDNWNKYSHTTITHSDNLRTLRMSDTAGYELLAVCSYASHYIVPEIFFNSKDISVEKISMFPETELVNSDGKLWTEIAYAPPNIPPDGILILKISNKKSE